MLIIDEEVVSKHAEYAFLKIDSNITRNKLGNIRYEVILSNQQCIPVHQDEKDFIIVVIKNAILQTHPQQFPHCKHYLKG